MGLIETIALILVVLWLLGFSMNFAGSLIHVLLVAAIVVFIFRFMRRSV